jgi:hypothetical protein
MRCNVDGIHVILLKYQAISDSRMGECIVEKSVISTGISSLCASHKVHINPLHIKKYAIRPATTTLANEYTPVLASAPLVN